VDVSKQVERPGVEAPIHPEPDALDGDRLDVFWSLQDVDVAEALPPEAAH
jgi:hypothetical protein